MQTTAGAPSTTYHRPWLWRLAALALAGIALFISFKCAVRLPLLQQLVITSERLQRAMESVGRSPSRDVQVADTLRYVADNVVYAWRQPDKRIEANSRVFSVLNALPNDGIPRYAAATLAMLSMEKDGTPPSEWWNRVKAWLDVKGTLSFSHGLAALRDRDISVYRAIGISPGLAARDAERAFTGGHGVFLQLLAPRLTVLRQQLRDGGHADIADRLTADWRRWLALWVRDPGPAELRMLAADLLAQELSSPDASQSDREHAAALTGWRNAWRSAHAGRAGGLPPLDPVSQRPEIAPVEHDRAARWIYIGLVALLALLTVCLVTVLTLFAREPLAFRLMRNRWALLAIAIPALITLVAFAPAFTAPSMVDHTLRAWGSHFSVSLLWPVLLTAAILLLTLFPLRHRDRLARLSRSAWCAIPGLSLLLVVAALQLSAALKAYDQRVATIVQERFENPFAGTDAPALPPPSLP